ncbi:MAG: TrmH family RNA methyltransferase [Candidatus Andersenbacteria bacterium]|nr:TrmH family RNA methyltransferase [Candidatus Andersenbacteria bacterium]
MKDFVVICDSLRSLHNVGSVFRTADGVGISKVYLCGITGMPDTQKHERQISKVALGAQNYVKWEYVKQSWRIVEKLKKEGYQIVSLEQTPKSISYLKFKPKFPLALIVGNEGKGVKKSLLKRSDKIINIPMRGQKESLNVSVAFGIAAYRIVV